MQLQPTSIEARSEAQRPQLFSLLYHELRRSPAAYSYALSVASFEDQLRLFDELEQTAGYLRPVITFDDGHLSDFELAMPVLSRSSRQAYFFITAGWTGSRAGYMAPEHIRALHDAGQMIGAHGWSHALLTRCTPKELKRELEDARWRLEDLISAPVRNISLPGGRGNASVLKACRVAGYTTVWTSTPGLSRSEHEPVVGRFNILATHTTDYLQTLLATDSNALRNEIFKSRLKTAGQRLLGDVLYARLWALLNHQEAEAAEVDRSI